MTRARPRLLAAPDFRRWYLAQSVSITGTAISGVALPLLVYTTSRSASLTAAVVGLEAVPYLLFGLLFGAMADRRPRRRMMVQADLLAALALVTVPVAHLVGRLTAAHVLLVAFGVGACFCWFDSAAWGALPRLVGKDRLAQANSLVQATAVVTGLAGPAVAGLLTAVTGPAPLLAIDAVSYVISAGLIGGIRTRLDASPTATPGADGRPGPPPAPRPAGAIGRDIGTGLRFIWRQPSVRALTIAGFGFSMAGGGILGLVVVHADRALGIHPGDARIGLVYTAGAVGSLAATWLLPRAARVLGEGAVTLTGYAVFVVATAALAAVANSWLGLAAWVVWDLAYTTAVVNAITVRQRLTPDDLQGRVNTSGRMIAWGGTPFGALLGGLVAQALSVRWAFLLLAAPVVVGLTALLRSPVRRLRLTTNEPADADAAPTRA